MRRAPGFTLIEVMIAVAIVAILAAIALPSYTEYMRRARVTDAVSQLSGMRVKMEQFFQDNRTYAGACQNGTIAPVPTSTHWTFSCPTLGPNAYLVSASGVGNMAPGVYTIDQSNVRATPTAPAGWSNNNCGWVLKKDGSC